MITIYGNQTLSYLVQNLAFKFIPAPFEDSRFRKPESTSSSGPGIQSYLRAVTPITCTT